MKDADLDRLLKQCLASTVEPEEALNQNIIYQIKESDQMKLVQKKSIYKKKLSVGLLAVVVSIVLSVSAYAAIQLFSANQVAEHLGDPLLAKAFESKDAIQINQTETSGDYRFTLHGLVSGAGLSAFPHSSEDIYPDRTYAVVSIARQDGKPMPNTDDPEYGKDPFFISPLIKGQKPWLVNIVTMNGAYNETVIDGVMYRIIECDQVEMFADRGVYLAISSGTTFYSKEAFKYDEVTGEVQAQEDYPGASLLFDLPLDRAKADHDKAEAYLETLLNPSTETSTDAKTDAEEDAWSQWSTNLRIKVLNGESIGETIPESIQEVSYDESGDAHYSYDGWDATMKPEEYFSEGQIGLSDQFTISGDADQIYKALFFHRDENGVITGRIVVLDSENIPDMNW